MHSETDGLLKCLLQFYAAGILIKLLIANGMCVLGGERVSRDEKATTGHIVVSEKVISSGTQVTLNNILTVTQDHSGLNIGVGDWESGDDEGGDAQ